jgi:hypothetical protein
MAYAHVASASLRYVQPSLTPVIADPAGSSGEPTRFAFHTLQAYRMPRHRLTAVPANVTTQARAGTDGGAGFMGILEGVWRTRGIVHGGQALRRSLRRPMCDAAPTA